MIRRLPSRRSSALVACLSFALVAPAVSCSKEPKQGAPSEGTTGAPAAQKNLPRPERNPSTNPALAAPIRGTVTLKIGAASKLLGPRSVALDKAGNLYVADTDNHRVVKFDPSGREVLQFGKPAAGSSEVLTPWQVVVTNQGSVLVLDPVQQAVLAYGPDGRFLSRFGGASAGLYSPAGLAATPDSTPLVADTGGNRLALLAPEGKPVLLSIQKVGKEDLSQPTEVAVDGAGNFLALSLGLTDNKGRLMKMSPDGALLGQWNVVGIPTTRDTPRIVVAPDGRIVMTDPEGHRVVVLSADLSSMRPVAVADATFKLVADVAVDEKGRLYVVDSEAGLIYRLELDPAH